MFAHNEILLNDDDVEFNLKHALKSAKKNLMDRERISKVIYWTDISVANGVPLESIIKVEILPFLIS